MLYNEFLSTIYNIVTGMTMKTGQTSDIVYTEINYEDFIELNPKSFPNQSGISVFLCPITFTFDESLANYGVRIYFLAQHKEDGTDKITQIGNCVNYAQLLLLKIPANMPGIVTPITITPYTMTDAVASGIYIDLQIRMPFNEGTIFPCA